MLADNIAVVILSAGQSTRFGSQKMNHSLADGKTILQTCIRQYQKVFSNVTVVISNDSTLERSLKDSNVNIVVAEYAVKGMSQSLITGIQSQINADAWLIALGDMPYIKTSTFEKLASQSTKSNIVVPVCSGRRGNPVIFGCDFQAELLDLEGDVGAKQIIELNQSRVLKVQVDDEGILHDIDRAEDIL